MQFYQGVINSCQTIATIGALGVHPKGRDVLGQLVSENGDTFRITFPRTAEAPIFVTRDECARYDELPTYVERTIKALEQEFAGEQYGWWAKPERVRHTTGDLVVQVLEIGYAKYQKLLYPQEYADVDDADILKIYAELPLSTENRDF